MTMIEAPAYDAGTALEHMLKEAKDLEMQWETLKEDTENTPPTLVAATQLALKASALKGRIMATIAWKGGDINPEAYTTLAMTTALVAWYNLTILGDKNVTT